MTDRISGIVYLHDPNISKREHIHHVILGHFSAMFHAGLHFEPACSDAMGKD